MVEKKYDVRFGLHNLDCGIFLGFRIDESWRKKKDRFKYYSEDDVGLEKSPVKDLLDLTNNHPAIENIDQSFLITAERISPFETSMGYVKNDAPEILALYLMEKNEGKYEVFDFTEYL